MDTVLELEELAYKKNLKLSVLEPDEGQHSGWLTLNRSGEANGKHRVFVQPCGTPTCGCSEVRFQCRADMADEQAATPDALREFWLDVKAQKVVLTAELKKEPKLMGLAEDVAAALTAEDWKRLLHWFGVAKLEIIENATAADVDVSNLPDSADGRMVPFVELFPFGLTLYFTWQDEIWVADEMYCVQPDCNCKETLLSFIKLQDATGAKTTSVSDPAGMRYNYRTGLAREAFPGRAGDPPTATLLAALKKARPHLNLTLERRHLLMQSIYLRHYLGRLSQATGCKVGRNERCPCGSGKKFKHCCLGKIQKA